VTVLPADAVVLAAGTLDHLEDLARPPGPADLVGFEDYVITDMGVHVHLLASLIE
jgi:hypothetical protein